MNAAVIARSSGLHTVAAMFTLTPLLIAAAAVAPGHFTAHSNRVDNVWFPLKPGSAYHYSGIKDGKPSTETLTVTHKTKKLAGVRCVTIDDRLFIHGKLEERTTDWYAQDSAGNVWYYGEQTATLDANGKVTSTEGTWRAGVQGAQPGIYMPAHPHVGQTARQEFFKGHAEDHFKILDLSASVSTPAATSKKALLTQETTPLEPGVVDHKFYVRGIGTVLEQTVKGGNERNTLESFTP
jgi:hypothetical protein